MEKQIQSLLIETSNVSAKTKKTSTSGEKKGSSLFDSLMKNSMDTLKHKQGVEKEATTSLDAKTNNKLASKKNLDVKSEVKEGIELTKKTDNIQNEENSQKKQKEIGTKEVKKSTNNSLLDRLVLEAKKSVKTNKKVLNEDIQKVDNSKDNIDIKDTTDVNSKNAKKKSLQSIKDVLIQEDKKEDNQEKSTKATNKNSLLDRLVLEAKKSVKTNIKDLNTNENKINNKTEDIKTNIDIKKASMEEKVKTSVSLKKENIKGNDSKENIETKVDLKEKDIKINASKEDMNEIKIIDNEIDKKEIKSNKSIKNDKNSLLDRLVQEAKKSIKSDVQDSSLDEKIVDKKIDKKESIDTTNKKEFENKDDLKKETKVNGNNSLLDRLVQEAKKSVKKEDETKVLDKQNIDKQVDIKNEDIKNEDIKNEEKKVLLDNPVDKLTTKEPINSENINNLVEIEKEEKVEEKIVSKPMIKDTSLVDSVKKDDVGLALEVDVKEVKEVKTTNSLLSQLIEETKQKIFDKKIPEEKKEGKIKEFLGNIFLTEQKAIFNTQISFNKTEALSVLKNATSLEDIKTAAKMLGLNVNDIDVEQIEQKLMDKQIPMVHKKNILDKLIFEKNIEHKDIQTLITNSLEASKALLDDTISISEDVEITVNAPLSNNIQTRIIGAKQQMANMMSDVARQMYENYKPPVTAFRINLHPSQLGTIAILMKNDKKNGITISLNASNSSTLDALVENQNILRTSLNNKFDGNTQFSFDFNSSSNDGNFSNPNGQNQNHQPYEEQVSTQDILNIKEDKKETILDDVDYM